MVERPTKSRPAEYDRTNGEYGRNFMVERPNKRRPAEYDRTNGEYEYWKQYDTIHKQFQAIVRDIQTPTEIDPRAPKPPGGYYRLEWRITPNPTPRPSQKEIDSGGCGCGCGCGG